jgi:hypothetical protein
MVALALSEAHEKVCRNVLRVPVTVWAGSNALLQRLRLPGIINLCSYSEI